MPNIEKNDGPKFRDLAQIERDSHNALLFQVQNRTYPEYMRIFNLNDEQMVGKEILDIGAGQGEFAKQAKVRGFNVTAFDMMYCLRLGREKLWEETKKKNVPNAVAGIAHELPFKNGAFDLVTNLFSAFYYARNEKEIIATLQEEIRVLKRGGKMLIFPLALDKFNNNVLIYGEGENTISFRRIVDDLESAGIVKGVVKEPLRYQKGRNFLYAQIEKLK